MKYPLFTSETFLKENTSVNDNIAGKYCTAALREAQEMFFKPIVGSTLFKKLQGMVEDGSIAAESNERYKDLLDIAQYLIACGAASELVMNVSYKITNAGVVKTRDENIENATFEEIAMRKAEYRAKADRYANEVRNYLLNNRASFPELSEGDVHRIHSCLTSTYSGGLWLGGVRGKRVR